MNQERFNELLAGPLTHPLPMFVVSRLVLALKHVVDAAGEAGEKALEEYCAARERQDAGEEMTPTEEGCDYDGPTIGPEDPA